MSASQVVFAKVGSTKPHPGQRSISEDTISDRDRALIRSHCSASGAHKPSHQHSTPFVSCCPPLAPRLPAGVAAPNTFMRDMDLADNRRLEVVVDDPRVCDALRRLSTPWSRSCSRDSAQAEGATATQNWWDLAELDWLGAGGQLRPGLSLPTWPTHSLVKVPLLQ